MKPTNRHSATILTVPSVFCSAPNIEDESSFLPQKRKKRHMMAQSVISRRWTCSLFSRFQLSCVHKDPDCRCQEGGEGSHTKATLSLLRNLEKVNWTSVVGIGILLHDGLVHWVERNKTQTARPMNLYLLDSRKRYRHGKGIWKDFDVRRGPDDIRLLD
jgi:hypothetical protein